MMCRRVLLLFSWIILIVLTGCSGDNGGNEILAREVKIPADSVKVMPETDLYPPQLHSDTWEEPIPMPGFVNTAGIEDSPFVTSDGNEFYFTFVPDVRVPPEKQLIDGVTGSYVSTLQGAGWSQPERVVLNDDLSLDRCECLQGNILWVCSVRKGNYRSVDMYTTEFVEGKWSHWQNAGKRLNEQIAIGEMHITVDGSEIYFDADRSEGKEGHDIWVTRKVNDEWQIPKNVAAVNTEENEIRPFITQDGSELWFSRRYMGSPAIFRSMNIGGEWGDPELIISQFAAEPSLDEQGDIYFAHHFIENGSMLEGDIYVAYKKDE
jgi:uncharacterized protein YrzB (UPF0473 family)